MSEPIDSLKAKDECVNASINAEVVHAFHMVER
jgi:hypothetical protein